jgi:hypothetical protein
VLKIITSLSSNQGVVNPVSPLSLVLSIFLKNYLKKKIKKKKKKLCLRERETERERERLLPPRLQLLPPKVVVLSLREKSCSSNKAPLN